jgi:hypothetical protein
MDASEIERYLAELGDELQQRGLTQPLRILVVGGAFMLTQIHNRSATNDIDVLLEDITDPAADLRYPIFTAAKRAVAARHQLGAVWINDVVGDALRLNGPVPAGTLWRTYAMLEVYMPPLDYVLALKLFAGRPQDRPDSLALCRQLGITTRTDAQNILDRYIPDQSLQAMHDVPKTLNGTFP